MEYCFSSAYRSEVAESTEIPASEKDWVLDGIQLFLKYCGESYLDNALGGAEHRFSREVLCRAAWAKYSIADLGHVLHSISECKGFAPLLREFKRTEKGLERETVAIIGKRFKSDGFIVEFDVEVKGKVPDLRCTDPLTGQSFFVEVSVLGPSDQALLLNKGSLDLALSQIAEGVETRTCIHRLDEEADLALIKKALLSISSEAKQTGKFVEYKVDDIADLAAAPFNQNTELTRLHAWNEARGMEPNVISTGPSFNRFDNLKRLRRTLIKEHRQLPDGAPNVVVIFAPDFISYLEPRFLKQVGTYLDEASAAFSNSIATALMSQAMVWSVDPNHPESWSSGRHVFRRRKLTRMTQELVLASMNASYQGALPKSTILGILNCLVPAA